MNAARKLWAVGVLGVLAVALIAIYITQWLTVSPPAVASAAPRQGETQLTLQTVASLGTAPHPEWVSYLVKDPHGHWVHSTLLQRPGAFDRQGHDLPVRHCHRPAQSVLGAAAGRRRQDDQPRRQDDLRLDPDLASHTFAIPDLGVTVPLAGVADDAKNQCSVAPCTLAEAHRTITFTFRTGAPGRYRWQCFVPCGAGFLFGFGGPMQTVGYMDGFLIVT